MAGAADESALLEKVLLRVGAADTDEQLQNAVSKFLPPILLKLSSQHEGVRTQVMELLSHINKRIKRRPLIQLPVEALLVQYQDPTADPFVTNFSIIYIKMGYPRLPLEKKAELVPSMLNALAGKPQAHKDSLLFLLMPVLGSVTVPRDTQQCSALFGLNDRPQLAKELSDFMLDTLLLTYGSAAQQTEQQPGQTLEVPSGMSTYSFKRVTGDSGIKPEELEKIKLGIVKFVSQGVFPDSDIAIHLIVAAADTRFEVANAAEAALAKIVSELDWSNPCLSSPLYRLFLGTKLFCRRFEGNDKPELCKLPAGVRIRLKIMPYLAKARGRGVIFPAGMQLFFEALNGVETNVRLKTMALQSFSVEILPSDPSSMESVGVVVLQALVKVIGREERPLKGFAYSAVGKLVQHVPTLVRNDLSLFHKLFEALSEEDTNTKGYVYHALLSMLHAFNYDMEDSNRQIMQALLAKQLDTREPMARLAAVRYLHTVFPGHHAPSRYLLLQVSCDLNLDVREAAKEALYSENSLEKLILPSFIEMVDVVTEKGTYKFPYNANHFSVMICKKVIMFIIMCAVKGANGSMTLEEFEIPRPTKWTPLLGRYFCQLQETDDGKDAVDNFLKLLEQLAVAELCLLPINALLDAVGGAPELLANRLSQKLILLKTWLLSPVAELREAAAQLYGTVIAHSLKDAEYEDAIEDLIKSVKGKAVDSQHSGVLALAHAFQRRINMLKEKQETDKVTAWPVYQEAVHTIVSQLDQENPLMLGAACSSIGELARCYALPLPAGSSDEKTGKLDVVKKMQSIANNPKTPSKLKEDAAMALGFLCIGEVFPHRREVIQGLLDMGKNSELEVHLTVGDALVCCVLGQASPSARDAWRVPEEEFQAPSCAYGDEDLEWLVQELINTMGTSTHPSIKQATCIWLVALLKHCGHHAPLQNHQRALQKTFMYMLGENNDIIQDAASKGLGLVYENSDETARNLLMTELLEQLTQGRRAVPQVTSDTKLFEEGQLSQFPSGGNLSTYKELCSLVSDLNQPDLIYKFMHLANHSALWDSKKGAAYGFSAISISAGEHLTKYFPKIVPRLYRYQYDPTPKIQKSMASIWGALVREPQKTIEQFYAEILTDLLTNLTDSQRRVRLSCCLALLDLLKGGYNKSLYDCLEELPHMWKQLFRVMDDMHEETRVAATNTTTVLSRLTVRSCDISQGKAGQAVLRTVLPVLLEVGIGNTVAEVRSISLQCVSQMVESAGKFLHPHLPQLIPALLEATGELESSMLRQLSVAMSGDPEKQEQIDALRISAAKGHYTVETALKCVPYIDSSTLEGLVPRLIELIRTSVGLGTRLGCVNHIVSLAQHLKLDLQPYAGKLLTALLNAVKEDNLLIKKYYGTGIGYVALTAKDSTQEKLMTKLRDLYFWKDDSGVQCAIAGAYQVIGRQKPELLKEYSSQVFPVIFFGMHATRTLENTGGVFAEVWSDTTPGTEAGIIQNFTAICSIIKEGLELSQWAVKSQAARTLITVASKATPSLDSTGRQELISLLISTLSGRFWMGKEIIFNAISTLFRSYREIMKQEDCSALVDAVFRECSKERAHYRQFAIEAIGDILEALEMNRFDDVYAIVQDILSKERPQEGSEILICERAYEALGKSWPTDKDTQVKYREKLLEECVSCLTTAPVSVKQAVMSSLRSYVDRLTLLQHSDQLDDEEQQSLNKIMSLLETAIVSTLDKVLRTPKHTSLKKETLNVVYVLIKKLKEARQDANLAKLVEACQPHLERASEDTTPEIMLRVADIKKLLKS